MRAYVATTGLLFALIVAAHAARLAAEGTRVLSDPFYLIATLAAAAMCLWAWRLFRHVEQR